MQNRKETFLDHRRNKVFFSFLNYEKKLKGCSLNSPRTQEATQGSRDASRAEECYVKEHWGNTEDTIQYSNLSKASGHSWQSIRAFLLGAWSSLGRFSLEGTI